MVEEDDEGVIGWVGLEGLRGRGATEVAGGERGREEGRGRLGVQRDPVLDRLHRHSLQMQPPGQIKKGGQ